MIYLVGSCYENYGEIGMVYLFEYMLFKGMLMSGNLMEQFSKCGVSFNGIMSDDCINYFEMMMNSGDNFEWVICMEVDCMVNLWVSVDDLKIEMMVVCNEFELGENNFFGLLYKQVCLVVFDWYNYGNIVIGNCSDVENVLIGNLKVFYKIYYQFDNVVVMLVGNFDEGQVLMFIVDSYGKVCCFWCMLFWQYMEENLQDGECSLIVWWVGDVQYFIVGYYIFSVWYFDVVVL